MRIAVASGKGGTGKTTVAVGLAVLASRAGLPVRLGDCDVEEPNAHLFLQPSFGESVPVKAEIPVVDQDRCDHCGACGEICQFNAIACLPDRTIVFPDLCHSCAGCWLVCPRGAIATTDRVLGEVSSGPADGIACVRGRLRVGETVVPPLVREVKRRAAGDGGWVILDAPPGASCPVVETLRDADFVLLVTEPTPFGLHDLAVAVELVRSLGRPCGVVVNRAGSGDDRVERFCAEQGIEIAARLPFSRAVAEAYAHGRLAVDADPAVGDAMAGLVAWLREREVRS